MKAPKEIIKLVERFEDNIDAYKSGRYNETQVRLEFINPFFKALGWDVDNVQGWAEAYKDVIHEDAIKIGGTTKAPDYCFRIGGTRKFFLEAKKPSVNIKNDLPPAFQLRRYAWSAKLPLSILTDFEEFAVYDCLFKPVKTDKASTARILYYNYKDYANKWEEISSIFSREAILKGSFDKYIDSGKKKRGTAEVDSAFLKEIESWRENLAKNIAIRNPKLSQRGINFSVQKIIDRIIFLRISEDRGLETNTLKEIGNKTNVYTLLCELFLKADKRYNSGLFHFKSEKDIATHPDELTLTIKLDDAPLKAIIKNLYYPDSPYEFSVLPPDILGHVYEQFLGKVIRLDDSHRAIIEEKPEVRKAGGVYYTPTYIVDYIVKNTVGKLLDGKTTKQAEKLKILDPACGSGSFLIGAYQYILDWHLKEHQEYLKTKRKVPNLPGKGKKHPAIYQGAGGSWRLTLYEKKRILLNNIYGVDIDNQAVEVTKLSLLLKVLEGESQMHLFHERILPDLGSNIKCGNSLIGPDFYENKPMDLFDEKERYRINVFDWKAEFPEILGGSNPGFDAVIGNPPYGGLLSSAEINYLKNKFQISNTDTAALFMCNQVFLLNKNGYGGFIIPKPFIYASKWAKVREYLIKNIVEIIDVSRVWKEAKLEMAIYVFTKRFISKIYSTGFRKGKNILHSGRIEKTLCKKFGLIPCGLVNKEIDIALKMIRKETFFTNVSTIRRGQDIQKYLTKDFDIEVYRCKSVGRYFLKKPKEGVTKEIYERHKPILLYMEKPKIIIQNIVAHVVKPTEHIIFMATLDTKGIIGLGSVGNISINDARYNTKYLIGLLNSKLLSWFAYRFIYSRAIRTMRFDNYHLSKLPFPIILFSSQDNKIKHDQMVRFVDQMLNLHKQLADAKTSPDKTAIQRQIDATDHQIDQLVYDLYDLTPNEIKIIEQSTK